MIQEIQSKHRMELSRVQDVANQAYHQAQVQLQEPDARVQNLMALVESQNLALENQRVQQEVSNMKW